MHKYVSLFIFLFCCQLCNNVFATDSLPKIIYFYDGDTVKINDGHSQFKLRISEIDAPERQQYYGLKSRRALIKLCDHADIDYTLYGYDRYQRRLGQLSCNHQSVSQFMVANGHAWLYRHYAHNERLANAEIAAKKKHLGLWADHHPMPPWQWRQKHLH